MKLALKNKVASQMATMQKKEQSKDLGSVKNQAQLSTENGGKQKSYLKEVERNVYKWIKEAASEKAE